MAGKQPVEIFEYTRNGEYVRKFKNQTLCRELHFSYCLGKMPILRFKRLGIEYNVLENGNYLFRERIGRSKIKFLRRVHESVYCTDLITKRKRIIQVFNLEGKLLLEARNLNVLVKLTNIPQSTISQALKHGFTNPKSEFSFKYKESEDI